MGLEKENVKQQGEIKYQTGSKLQTHSGVSV